jgi:hypothetical protein
MRANLFDKWEPLGFDLLAIGRAANRVGTDEAWKTGLTAGFLMCTFGMRGQRGSTGLFGGDHQWVLRWCCGESQGRRDSRIDNHAILGNRDSRRERRS